MIDPSEDSNPLGDDTKVECLGNTFAEFSAELCLTAWKAGREFEFESRRTSCGASPQE